jgi:hypothetical protein
VLFCFKFLHKLFWCKLEIIYKGNMGIGYDGIKGEPGEKGASGLPGKHCLPNLPPEFEGGQPSYVGLPGKDGDKGQKVLQ